MSRIQRLSPSLINKIAAGEVIERPASVVKELVENSIDAGARRIDVIIEKGGLDLIRIVDDGCGMDGEDLLLAVASHATSKLRAEEDLFHVATMGFRGEAMASVAEISHMTIRSRVNPERKPTVGEAFRVTDPELLSGFELFAAGGEVKPVVPCGVPPGTSIEVRNLFFNTPVRRKFMRSPATEFSNISEAFGRLALANPQIHFRLTHNGRTIHDLPATESGDWLRRIADLEGRELADGLLFVEKTFGEIRIQGYAARPNFSRSNPKMQHLFLNGRPIRDRSLYHALNEAYRGLLMTNRYPICFLRLEMPLALVDVNVHPTKMEVRFQDSGTVYQHLLSTLRSKFLTTNLATFVDAHDPSAGGPLQATPFRPVNETFRNMDAPSEEGKAPAGGAAHAGHRPPQPTGESGVEPFRPFGDPVDTRPTVTAPATTPWLSGLTGPERRSGPASGVGSESREGHELAEPHESGEDEDAEASEPGSRRTARWGAGSTGPLIPPKVLQVHDRYIVTECPEGLMVVDQHAMHERILYERLKARVLSVSVEVQRLLIPEPLDLSPTDATTILEHRKELESLGILLEPFGGNTILVHGVPAMLFAFDRTNRVRVDELIYDILQVIRSQGASPTLDVLIDDALHTIACKSAVKAGQRLSVEEMTKLLDEYADFPQADHCPHGRPSVLIWTCQELDKMFCRIL